MPYYYGFDWTYFIYVLPFLILSLWAGSAVKNTYQKYSKQISRRNLTGAQAAQRVLSYNGVTGVQIQRTSGVLTDHYDPKANVIRLSEGVYDSPSTAAIGVACHEAGHAVQYAKNYAPIKLRTAIIPITNIGSKLAIPLILIGILFTSLGYYSDMIVYLGIGCYALSLLFQFITLPVEFNASRRAMEAIRTADLLTEEEMKGAKKVLTSAAMTYVAAAAAALGQLLRLITLFGRRRRND